MFWLLKIKLMNHENQPPAEPLINGSDFGEVGEEVNFSFFSEDYDEDKIYYYIDWGDGTFDDWFGPFKSGEEVIATHIWKSKGTYNIISKAKDIYNEESDWSEPFIIRIGNTPPNKPDIDGPNHGKSGEYYDYIFTATDPDGDNIWYHIGWGDKEKIYIYGPYNSSESITLNYTWTQRGSYTITCWVRDVFDEDSDITNLEVVIPRGKLNKNNIFYWIFTRIPFLKIILKNIYLRSVII